MAVIPAGYVPGIVCTLKKCSVAKWGFIHYRPSMPGNILFLVIFAFLGIAQLFLGIKYKTGLVCISMLLGLTSEVIGYIARVLMNGDPFDRTYFLIYLICLTLQAVGGGIAASYPLTNQYMVRQLPSNRNNQVS